MAYNPPASRDHAIRGLSRVLEQLKNKPRFQALLKTYLNRIQELENAVWEVVYYRLLENAEGAQLDALGRIVGRGRGDLNDADYRLAIKGQIRINRSCGTPEDLISVTGLSIPVGSLYDYGELYPATVLIEIISAVNFNISVTFENLLRTKSGGVRLFLSFSVAAPENTFTFAPTSTPDVNVGQGFGNASNPATGGVLASVLASSP